MDNFAVHLSTTDTKKKLSTGQDIIDYLGQPENPTDCEDLGGFIDALVPWMQSSNFKVWKKNWNNFVNSIRLVLLRTPTLLYCLVWVLFLKVENNPKGNSSSPDICQHPLYFFSNVFQVSPSQNVFKYMWPVMKIVTIITIYDTWRIFFVSSIVYHLGWDHL